MHKVATTYALQHVLGVHYGDVIIYNHEDKTLLTKKYNDADVFWNADSGKMAAASKEMFDENFKRARLSLVCTVAKQVATPDYPGWIRWTRPGTDVPMNPMGKYTVCNFIVRDEMTGDIRMLYADSWLGTWYSDSPENVSRYGAARIMLGAERPAFWRAVHNGYKHRR